MQQTFREKFRVVVADCPWSFDDKLKMSAVKRGAEANYRILSNNDIRNIPIQEWTQENSILALWIPSALIDVGLNVMDWWGYQQKQIYTWIKTSKKGGLGFGMGHHFRGCTEHALIGIRGKIKPNSRSERNCDLHLALPHSQKPEQLQDKLQKMYDGPYLELFARRKKENWTCVGNESPDINCDIRDWKPEFTNVDQ